MAGEAKGALNWWPVALWIPVNIPLAPVWQGSVVVSGAKVYLIGGSKCQVNVQEYQSRLVDLSTGSFQLLPPMRTPRYGAVAGIAGSEIIVAGGVSFARPEASEKLSSVEIYNTSSNTWTQGPPLPCPLAWAAGGVVNNKLIMTGGYSDKREGRTLILDFKAGGWSAPSQMPAAVSHAAAAVYNGKLYIFGGIDWKSAHQRSCFIYDAAANNWTVGAQMPDPRASAAAVVLNNEILITGGTRDIIGLERREVFVFNPESNLYGESLSMNFSRSEHATCIYGGVVYAIGGNEKSPIEAAAQNFALLNITPSSKEIKIQFNLQLTQGRELEGVIGGKTEAVDFTSFRALTLKPVALPSTSSLLIRNSGLTSVRITYVNYGYILSAGNQMSLQLTSMADIYLSPVVS